MIKKQVFRQSLKNLFQVFVISSVLTISPLYFLSDAYSDDNGTSGSSNTWTMFRGNAARTGKTTLVGPPDEIEMKWRWRYGYDTDPVSASPVVGSDGTVYIGTEGGRLAAVKPGGGSGWVYQQQLAAFKASPAVDASGNLLAVTKDGYMYFIGPDGELQWKCDFKEDILSSPLITSGLAYVGTNYYDVKGINLNPDDSLMSEGSKKIDLWDLIVNWSFVTPDFKDVKSSPAFYGNTLFFGAGDYIYAVNPTSGDNETNSDSALKWMYDCKADVDTTPAVHNGVVYVTTSRGRLYAFEENTANEYKQGDVIWQRSVGSGKLTSPAVSEGSDGKTYIYVGSADGKLYAFDQDGKYVWTNPFSTLGDIESSPAVDGNGDIYFGSNDGNIYALYPDGSLKWNYMTWSKVRSSPAIGPDNLLYVGCDNGYLYCIGESTEDNREPNIAINVSVSNNSILENDGSNYVSITAKIVSADSGGDVDLNKISSVSIDLSSLNLVDASNSPLSIELMYDDGLHDDGQANDGTYTYEFKATKDVLAVAAGDIPTYYFSKTGVVPDIVGPFPVMITATDIFGNRKSEPTLLNVMDKKYDCSPSDTVPQTITNRIDGQTLIVEFTPAGVLPSILAVYPFSGQPGQIIEFIVIGSNTNFRKDESVVQVLNDAGFPVAFTTDSDDIIKVSDEYLMVNLTILNPDYVDNGTLIGKWDVVVTTGSEVVTGDALFTITNSPLRSSGDNHLELANLSIATPQLDDTCSGCCYKVEVKNESGSLLREPFRTNTTVKGTFEIEDVDIGVINYFVTMENCLTTLSYDITTEADNFGYLKGEVINGLVDSLINEPFETLLNNLLGVIPGVDIDSVDGATVSAAIGDTLFSDNASTLSSGGGHYILPLAASTEPYTVLANKNLLSDLETDIIIRDGEATEHNFSIKPDLSCLISSLFGTSSLKTFYSFRDNVLLQSRTGQRWTDMYYTHSWEVLALATSDPEIMAQCIQTLFYAVVSIPEYRLTGKAGFMFALSLNELLEMLEDDGSDALRSAIQSEKEAILSFAGADYLN